MDLSKWRMEGECLVRCVRFGGLVRVRRKKFRLQTQFVCGVRAVFHSRRGMSDDQSADREIRTK